MATKPDIWMPLYIADYLADTPYLTTEQHGAYLLLIMAYWRSGPPPDNDQILASLVKMTPDAWSIARPVLERFFNVGDGHWLHARVEREFDKAKKNRAAAHDKAARAAAARWEKEKARRMLEALPEHMPEQCPSPSPSPSPKPTQIPEVQDQDTSSPAAPVLAQDRPPDRPVSKPKPAANGTRLPTDWALSQELGEWALTEGLTRDQIRREADSFRDYWIAKPGAAGRKTDWAATWRNWIRRSTQSAPGGRNNGKPERLSNAERVARDAERHLAELDRLDREDSQMEQGDRALGYDFVPPDRLAVPGQSG